MTKQNNQIKYTEAAQVGRRYGVKQGVADATCFITALGGLTYSALELAKNGNPEEYVAGLGVMLGSYLANKGITKINKKNQEKALKKLDEVEFEITNPERIIR